MTKNKKTITQNGGGGCDCVFCKNNMAFEMPEALIKALLEGNLVLFAGAGISTENDVVFPVSFYQTIKNELGIGEDVNISFPSLMTKYCEVNGQASLLQKIKERFDYMKAFPELYRNASRFHGELSTIFEIKNIVTTNWDTIFEDECGATPMVNAQDFAFWNTPGRKVFKIHGSINNMGSVVATENDYSKAYRNLNSGIIGSSLKLMLGTKTALFIGYSFSDPDFNRVYNFLKKEMGNIIPRSYIVTPHSAPAGFKGVVINTDGVYFVKCLKEHLVKNKHMIDDNRFNDVHRMLFEVREAHDLVSRIDYKRVPSVIYCTSYQDGMIHAYERILALQKTGYYSHVCNIIKTLENYEILRKMKVKNRAYFDVAYIDGYLNGISYLWLSDKLRKTVPIFYLYGNSGEIRTFKKFLHMLKDAPTLHRGAHKLALEITQKYNSEILHHTPFIY
ncbi:MAG: SIR2 family protein [Candidatus Pacebacteria bacterium]|jgi:hypothetical protein|nr:SIR2 family protein [Candidatus Paceibacterota bacterium]